MSGGSPHRKPKSMSKVAQDGDTHEKFPSVWCGHVFKSSEGLSHKAASHLQRTA